MIANTKEECKYKWIHDIPKTGCMCSLNEEQIELMKNIVRTKNCSWYIGKVINRVGENIYWHEYPTLNKDHVEIMFFDYFELKYEFRGNYLKQVFSL